MPVTSSAALLAQLERRFAQHHGRHPGVAWVDVLTRIKASRAALKALAAMEETGGEPDVIGRDPNTGGLLFCDCSPESPAGRRSLCYDKEARVSRKEHAPDGSAIEMAAQFGIELLDEAQYAHLQTLGEFDLKTSSWLRTPPDIRTRGGALFGDRRYGRAFTYHNGAQSYYDSRGFRGLLRV